VTDDDRSPRQASADESRVLDLPIRTARLRLRDFTVADGAAVHAYASDPEVARFLYWGPRDEAESRDYVGRMLAIQRERPRSRWELAIVRAADGRVLGACDLTHVGPGEADLGYVLARAAWGRGYATEAARALVAAGFARLGLRRIVATCDPANAASARVLEKAGLRRAAFVPRHEWAKGRWWDALRYELQRDERGAGGDAG
jgi:RimJ/RimL family protein N-acetyltransferase